jgi:hypothetical protein
VYQPVRLDRADVGRSVVGVIVEAQPLPVAGRAGDGGEHGGVDGLYVGDVRTFFRALR